MHYIRNAAVGRCVCVIKSFMQLFKFDKTGSKYFANSLLYKNMWFHPKSKKYAYTGQNITDVSLYNQNSELRYTYCSLKNKL